MQENSTSQEQKKQRIKSMFSRAKNQAERKQAIHHSFILIDKQARGQNVTALQTRSLIPRQKSVFMDPHIVYPLTKMGNFGKLDRSCRIVETGIMESQGSKQAKLKSIINFKNKIQTPASQNNEKLDWHQRKTVYPYRIILVDSNNHLKAIYFKTKEEAERIRIHYMYKFNALPDGNKVMEEPFKRYRKKLAQVFVNALVTCQTLKHKKTVTELSKSKSIDPIDKIIQTKQSQSQSRLFSQKSNKYLQPSISPYIFSSLQNEYIQNFFLEWKLTSKIANVQQQSYIAPESKINTPKQHKNKDILYTNSISESKKYTNPFEKAELPSKESGNEVNYFMRKSSSKNVIGNISQQYSGMQQVSKEQTIPMKKSAKKQSFMFQASKYSIQKSRIQKEKAVDKQWIQFQSIELLKQEQIFIKPIVKIIVRYRGKNEYQGIFNTILKQKKPHLQYQLRINDEESNGFNGQIGGYEVYVEVTDFLSKRTLCSENIKWEKGSRGYLEDEGKKVRLDFSWGSGKNMDESHAVLLELQPIHESLIQKVGEWWQEEANRKGYYNSSRDIPLLQILQLAEMEPPSWVIGLSPALYQLAILVHKAANIIGFKITQAIVPICSALLTVYPDKSQLIKTVISLYTNYLHAYCLPTQLHSIQQFHRMLGLEGQLQFNSKISLEMDILKGIVVLETPMLDDKMRRRNISYVHMMFEFIYELFAKNFPVPTLMELWNFLFCHRSLLQLYFTLIAVWLFKFYAQKILSARRPSQLRKILQSKCTPAAEAIIADIIRLREKYFGSKTFFESIKQMLGSRPLQPILTQFYKKQSLEADAKKSSREIHKQKVISRLNEVLDPELPTIRPARYTFHIFFYQVPSSSTLCIRSQGVKYECLGHLENPYYIIADVTGPLEIVCVINEVQYRGEIVCTEGINRYRTSVKNGGLVGNVEYLCGLLDDDHIQRLIRNKGTEGCLGSFIKRDRLYSSLNSHMSIKSLISNPRMGELASQLEALFAMNNSFDSIDLYLRWVANSCQTLPEKLYQIKKFSQVISRGRFLSEQLVSLDKLFTFELLKLMKYPISEVQFQSLYSDSVEYELDAPKVLKCRVYLASGKELKLDYEANQYYSQKCCGWLYGDLVLEDLLGSLKPSLSGVKKATVYLLYSSNGSVHCRQFGIRLGQKEFSIEENKFIEEEGNRKIDEAEPQLLMTEVLPTFSKISTILQFVNNISEQKTESKQSNIEQILHRPESRPLPQCINLLKHGHKRLNHVVEMRYGCNPSFFSIPFLGYFHELMQEKTSIPKIPKNIYLNHAHTDLKTICVESHKLEFTLTDRNNEAIMLSKELELYWNLRKVKGQNLYFWSLPDDDDTSSPNAEMFVNYGYGIYRWEPCFVKGFRFKRKGNSGLGTEGKQKKQYQVFYRGRQTFLRDYQLKIPPALLENLTSKPLPYMSKIRQNLLK